MKASHAVPVLGVLAACVAGLLVVLWLARQNDSSSLEIPSVDRGKDAGRNARAGEADIPPSPPGPPPRPVEDGSRVEPEPRPPEGAGGKAAGIRARVVDEAARPVAGAWAVLVPWERIDSLDETLPEDEAPVLWDRQGGMKIRTSSGETGSWSVPAGCASATSDAGGCLSFPETAPGRTLLLAGSAGFRETWRELTLPVAGPESGPLLVLSPGLEIGGRVVDAGTGEGIAGVELTGRQETPEIGGLPRTRGRKAVSGKDGSFRLRGFAPGRAALRAVAIGGMFEVDSEGVREPIDRLGENEAAPLEVQAGDPGVVVRMIRMGIVEFPALEKDSGQPLQASLRATGKSREQGPPRTGVCQVGPGKFRLRDRPGQREYTLAAEGFEPVKVFFDVPSGSTVARPEPVFFTPEKGIEGWVTIEKAEGVDGETRVKGVRVFYERLQESGGSVAMVMAKPEGPWRARFRISSFEAGRYRLVAVAPGYASSVAEVLAGEAGARQDFHLLPRRPGMAPPEKRIPYRERMDVTIAFSGEDLVLEEALDWIGEATRADLRLRPGTKAAAKSLSLDTSDVPLSSAVELLKMIGGLEFDEETGEFFEKE